MKYQHVKEDLMAIDYLVRTGRIDSIEAHEMREYLESIA